MRKLIILSCLCLSVILFYLSFVNLIPKPERINNKIDETEASLRLDSTKINLNYFNENYSTDKITAIGVIASETCSSCVTELLEYSKEISRLNEKFYNSKKIEKYFAVIGNDSISAFRFQKAHNISSQTFFFNLNWDKNKSLNQWVFVNNRSSKITSRILVLNRLTPTTYKKDLLNKAIFY